jgi:hypothetical protein
MESKLKHLDFIQAVINRMSNNSFLIKGWSVTLVSAVFVLSTKDGNSSIIPVAYLPVLVFWFLDAYFLRQERLFRKHYDVIRAKDASDIDFSLNVSGYSSMVEDYFKTILSITLRWFHGALLLIVIFVNIITFLEP